MRKQVVAETDSNSTAPGIAFIVAAGRSGTTLLRLILDAHSAIYSGPEDQLALVHFARWHRIDPSPQRLVREVFSFQTASGPLVSLWGLDGRRPELEQRLGALGEGYTLARGIQILGSMVLEAKAPSASIWCLKTPHYALYPEILELAAPNAVIIHLVRDGRDVARSFLEGPLRWQIEPPTYGRAALYWRSCNRSARRFAASFQDRYVRVRYEDLVDDPRPVISTLCDALGVEFEESMLAHQEQNRSLEKITANERAWHGATAGPIDPAKVGRGAVAMTSKELEEFSALAGAELTRYGYGASETVSVSARLSAWTCQLRFALGHRGERVKTWWRWVRRYLQFRRSG